MVFNVHVCCDKHMNYFLKSYAFAMCIPLTLNPLRQEDSMWHLVFAQSLKFTHISKVMLLSCMHSTVHVLPAEKIKLACFKFGWHLKATTQ